MATRAGYSATRFGAMAGLQLSSGWPWSLGLLVIVLLGGANWTMPLSRLIGELAGACMLIAAFALPKHGPKQEIAGRFALADKLWLALLGLFALHLVPLPPQVWTALPGREVAAMADSAVFGAPGWRPFTLDPQESWRALLMLVPAMAVYVAARRGGPARQEQLLGGAALAGLLGLLISMLQLALPGSDWLHFYPKGDYAQPIGFFTNRNHHAVFLLCALPLTTAWLLLRRARLPQRRYRHPGRDPGRERDGWLLAGLTTLTALAVLTSASRAGATLLPFSLAGTALVWWSLDPAPQRPRPAALARLQSPPIRLAICVAIALALALLIVALGGDGLLAVLKRSTIASDSRFVFWPNVLGAAMHYWPVGSGLGTFIEGYEMFEPAEALTPLYLNHAHNDYLEVFLEAGVPGLVLALVAVWELGLACLRVWRDPAGQPAIRLAAIALMLPLLHALVDYPLRTLAISSLAALAAAMLMEQAPELEAEPAAA